MKTMQSHFSLIFIPACVSSDFMLPDVLNALLFITVQAQTAEYLRKQQRRANHSLQFAGKDLMLPALCTEMALKSTMCEN